MILSFQDYDPQHILLYREEDWNLIQNSPKVKDRYGTHWSNYYTVSTSTVHMKLGCPTFLLWPRERRFIIKRILPPLKNHNQPNTGLVGLVETKHFFCLISNTQILETLVKDTWYTWHLIWHQSLRLRFKDTPNSNSQWICTNNPKSHFFRWFSCHVYQASLSIIFLSKGGGVSYQSKNIT